MTWGKITDRDLWTGLTIGLAAIAAWFLATRTTLFLAYGTSGTPHDLAQAQSMCDGGLGQFARALNAQAAANCTSVDTYAMWLNLAGFAGLLLAAASVAVLAYRHNRPSAATTHL